MATYCYRCPDHGPFEITTPIGTAAATASCPACRSQAVRVFTPPLLGHGDRQRLKLIDRCERTRSEPDVVSAPPAAARPGVRAAQAANPAWRRLPRP